MNFNEVFSYTILVLARRGPIRLDQKRPNHLRDFYIKLQQFEFFHRCRNEWADSDNIIFKSYRT